MRAVARAGPARSFGGEGETGEISRGRGGGVEVLALAFADEVLGQLDLKKVHLFEKTIKL